MRPDRGQEVCRAGRTSKWTVHIRPATWADRDAAYAVALATGDSGADAAALHTYPDLIGEVFVGPYLRFAPDHAFMLVDDTPCGYVLGVSDTRAFEAALVEDWWPEAQQRSRDLADPTDTDRWLIDRIAHPVTAPEEVVAQYPAHGHIDLMERAQGRGLGLEMMARVMASLAESGATGMHLEVSPDNARALAFYARLGFSPIVETADAVYLGRPLP